MNTQKTQRVPFLRCTSCEDSMTKAIIRQDQLLALTLKVDDSDSLLKEQDT